MRLHYIRVDEVVMTPTGTRHFLRAVDPNVIRLELKGWPVSDDDLELVAKLTGLHNLDLQETRVTGPGLKHLVGLKKLAFLYLGQNQILKKDADAFRKARPDCRVCEG